MTHDFSIQSNTAGKFFRVTFGKGSNGTTNVNATEVVANYSDGKYTGFTWEPFADDAYTARASVQGRNTKGTRDKLFAMACAQLREHGKITGEPVPFMP